MEKTKNEKRNDFCVILAGGKGRRLWPCSREQHPKQFMDFFGTGRTLLQQTYDRFVKIIPKERILVCTNKEYKHYVEEQLPELPAENILSEPIHRNTAPSVGWACFRILRLCEKGNVIIAPSDQMVFNEEKFAKNIEEGLCFVSDHNRLLTLGVQPTRAESGYGYIQKGENNEMQDVFSVKSFTEKPEREFALMFMNSGEFLWNTGIFLSDARHLIRCLRQSLPSVMMPLEENKEALTLETEQNFVKENFSRYPNLSIDYAVLEKTDNVFVMKCDFGWADLGTWHSIYEAMCSGSGENVVIDSRVVIEDCKDNIIKLPKEKLAIVNGLEGYIVVEKDNLLLICKKENSPALIRKYINEVQIQYGNEWT